MSSLSNKLTQTQLKEIREAFDIFDKDKSGTISRRELRSLFKSLSIQATDEEIKKVMRQMDDDGDGEISFEEFAKILGAEFYNDNTPEEIKAAFRFFDKDNNGYVTHEELKNVLRTMGKKYSDSDIKKLIQSIDRDGNGKISIEEFAELLR